MSSKVRSIACAIGLLVAASAFADDGVSITNTRPRAAVGPDSGWTAERLRNAKPMFRARTLSAQSAGTSHLDFTRSRITPQTANIAAPYKAVGKLFFSDGVDDFQCSASIIGQRLVVTAAHCVQGEGTFFTDFIFIPGYDGSQATLAKQRPFGTWGWSWAIVPTNWVNTNGALPNATDFAIIEFADQTFDGGGTFKTLYGKVGSKFATAVNHLADTHVTILGYPCNFDSCNIMQRVDSTDQRSGGNNAYEYGSDMTGGSSGGPWVENFGNPASAAPQGTWTVRNAVVGVTSYGYDDGGALLVQGASNFNATFTSLKNTACSHQAGNC